MQKVSAHVGPVSLKEQSALGGRFYTKCVWFYLLSPSPHPRHPDPPPGHCKVGQKGDVVEDEELHGTSAPDGYALSLFKQFTPFSISLIRD